MKCLFDGDLLVYECAFAGEYLDEETGERLPKPFDDVKEIFDQRVKEIEAECWANEPSKFFLTGDARLNKIVNRQLKREKKEPIEFKPNFRVEVAKTTPYKQRKSTKPYHFHNLRAYILAEYDVEIAWGMEADDLLAINQDKKDFTTIICSRDKDLRAVPGMFYSWACGNQPGFGPTRIDVIGDLSLPRPNKLTGTGLKFFYAQMIMGDAVDTIKGLPRGGPSLAFKTLNECTTHGELFQATASLYEAKVGEGWREYFKEQADLLWMVREIDEEGNLVMYKMQEEVDG